MLDFDCIVIGAGWSGTVVAGELARAGQRVLVLEKRPHIGGNCHDFMDEHGIRVHSYGPHLFHTDFDQVWEYLSQYTQWWPYEHRVLAEIDGQLVPIPFNLNTIDALFDAELAQRLKGKLIQRFGMETKVPILRLREEKDPDLEFLASFVYDKVFKNYTAKQWGMSPDQIDPAVTARVPVSVSRDNRYFQDRYQALPAQGYTAVFEQILNHSNIELRLGTDYQSLIDFDGSRFSIGGQPYMGKVIYTGQIDTLFGNRYGELAYRALAFDYETVAQDYFQPTTTVNYPNTPDMTRITEYKHISPGATAGITLVMREYPGAYQKDHARLGIPYYPIFTPEHQKAYELYAQDAAQVPGLYLIGRLAEYKYYDQDDAILSALKLAQELIQH